jgi:two-component system, cell cycle sensor histidine kinase and response regulator CckA
MSGFGEWSPAPPDPWGRKESVSLIREAQLVEAARRQLQELGRRAGSAAASAQENELDSVVLELTGIVDELAALLARRDVKQVAVERYRTLLSNATDLVSVLDATGALVYQSPAAEGLFGYSAEELVGASAFERLHPDDVASAEQAFAGVLREPGARVTLELRFRRKDGEWAWVECTVRNLLDDPTVGGVVVNTRDIGDRKEAEQALRESEQRFRALFEGSLDAMLLTDDDWVVVDANEAACAMFGRSYGGLVGLRPEELTELPAEAATTARKAFLAGEHRAGEWSLPRPDGSRREVEFRATANVLPGQHLWALRDVTERRELEEQLRQAQKMEAIGRLAGGIAHDFNNLLTAISGYTALAAAQQGTPEKARGHLDQVARAAERAASLTQQLLAFSRRQVLRPVAVDLNRTIEATAAMLSRLLDPQVSIELERAPSLRRALADPTQVDQILLNLALNASDAMPGGGVLTIATANVDVDDAEAERLAIPSGEYVSLTVSDTGSGMDEHTRPQIFEPFFTTKPEGKGTGLGLATVFGIVSQSNGAIAVDSEVGRGTRFTILLPAGDAEEQAGPYAELPLRQRRGTPESTPRTRGSR